MEQLYQNLVKTTPVRERKKIDTIDGEWNPISENKIEDAIGKQIYFEFEMTMKLELFGVEKKLYGLLGIFNAVLSDYSKKGNKQKITLSDEKADKQRYTVALYFKDEIELKNYRKKKQDEYFEDFRDAKDVNDYLDKR